MSSLQYPFLALDTSGACASVAVATFERLDCAVSVAHHGHSQTVLALADDMLQSAQVDRAGIQTLVVVHGPGSFTGLRVAVSLAQGIAMACHCQVIAVDALLATAWNAIQNSDVPDGQIVLVAHDARLSEIYAAAFCWDATQFVPIEDARLASASEVCRWFDRCISKAKHGQTRVIAAGSAWEAFDELAHQAKRQGWSVSTEAFARADAAILAAQGSTLAQVQCLENVDQLQPVYLRNKVALNSVEQTALRWRKQFSTLRPVAPSEAGQLAQLEATLQTTPWSEQSFLQAISSGCVVQAFGLQSDPTTLLAYFVLLPVVDEMQLLNIGVASPWQGNGLGRWLLEQAIVLSKLMGAQSILLEVRQSNEVARSLYSQFGFQPVGVRKAYYATATASREDAIVMRLNTAESV